MSKEQIGPEVAPQNAAGAAGVTEDPTHGLRADLYAQIMRMSPAESTSLAEMIENYPGLMGKIMLVAAPHMGNAAVQQAIATVKQMRSVSGAQASLKSEETREAMGDASSRALTGKEVIDSIHDPSQVVPETAPQSEPAAQPAAEPPWVAGARRFNRSHAGLVAEFHELTNDSCRLDGVGDTDPLAVAHWQAHHGLVDDGKIGAQTIAAARSPKTREPGPGGGESGATSQVAGKDGGKQMQLSPELNDRLLALGPDDLQQLTRLIAQCPADQRDALLVAARTNLGNAMVARALDNAQSDGR
jgi:hypothetical protein